MSNQPTPGSAHVAGLRNVTKGTVLTPGDPGYDEARKIWNGMVDRRPAVIARCTSASDVAAAIAFACDHDLLISVRGGGHSLPGHSVNDGGMMIDLQPMKRLEVNAQEHIARAQPGLLWGELDAGAHAHSLAVTGGQISHTGIAGLTLGGGIGWLMRRYGLTCDNLAAAEVVTADGRAVAASADDNPDLFWGLRGGGGNFGVVTEFSYRLHPVSLVFGGLVAFPLPAGKPALQALRSYLPSTPDELTTTSILLTTPDGHKALGVGFCYCGNPGDGEAWLAPIRQMGPVVMEQVGVMPYPVVQSMLDEVAAPGRRYYLKSNFMDELNDDAIDVLIEAYMRVPSPLTAVLLVQMGGAVARVDRTATAFYHRDVAFSFSAFASWIDPSEDDANIGWTRQLWQDLRPHMSASVYVNELVDEGEERVREAYGPAYDRLAALKRRYDPDNVFRLNQNIRPRARAQIDGVAFEVRSPAPDHTPGGHLSGQQQGVHPVSTEHNKTAARQFFMEQDQRKGPLAPEIVASDYVARIGSNPPMDMAGHSGFGAAFYRGFPDLYHTIDDVIAEGDKVVVRFTLRGAQTADFMGIPATDKPIEVSAIAILTFVDGKVAQLTAQFDQLGMLQQLDVIPASN